MSEHVRQFEDAFSHADCGSIELVYNDELLERTLLAAQTEHGLSFDLAKPAFLQDIHAHILSASASVLAASQHTTYINGEINYDRTKTIWKNRFIDSKATLPLLTKHLSHQVTLEDFDITLSAPSELELSNTTHVFRISTFENPANQDEITIDVSAAYDTGNLLAEDVISVARIWAYICDYVVRLGAGERTAFNPNQVSHVYFGETTSTVSDIETAIQIELELMREKLGVSATLPLLPGLGRNSDVNQAMIHDAHITPDELAKAAQEIIQDKREHYAIDGIMTDIEQTDVVTMLARVVMSRDYKAI